jgi:putative membrane protein
MVMALLTTADKQRIEGAIGEAEARTSGEIVVAVVRSSENHALPRATGALISACGAGIAIHHLVDGIAADWMLAGVVPLAALFYYVWGFGPLLRLLVPVRYADAAARARAQLLFAQHGLHLTRDRTGVLIMLSELERRAVILGDRGIDGILGSEGWVRHVEAVTLAVRQGRVADGLVAAVREIGELLAERVPRRSDDTNEISNSVLEED